MADMILPFTLPFTLGGEPAGPVSPNQRQQETLQPGRYMLRHIAPQATEAGKAGVINPAGSGFQVLAQTLYAEPLPVSRLPDSPDFHEGRYTLRMLDAGDWELTFPNKDASDGRPWRERFSTDGHTEFVEISREGEIESIGVVVKQVKDRQKITISGYDPFWLLKKAFEQDYTAVIAPRDLIERYSQLWTISLASEFPAGRTLAEDGFEFEPSNTGTGTSSATIGAEGGCVLTTNAPVAGDVGAGGIFNAPAHAYTIPTSGRWSLSVTYQVLSHSGFYEIFSGITSIGSLTLKVNVDTGLTTVPKGSCEATFAATGVIISGVVLPYAKGAHTIFLESDGRWVRAYLDGVLIGLLPTKEKLNATAFFTLDAQAFVGVTSAASYLVQRYIFRQAQPFLMRGTAKGDYVLPGAANSYPTGGLHGRYIVQGATTTAQFWWNTILSPDPRRSGFPTYIEDQQATINSPEPTGVPAEYYAARWFGAVYLDLEHNTEIPITLKMDDGARLWIGKTQWGQQIFDQWGLGGGEKTVSVKASELGAKKGWFPIILEYFNGPGVRSCVLSMTPGTGWTDPGGTVLTGGVKVVIPSTSLSPLGCVDARIQGSSFFDLVQETAKNFGYQLACEPKQLESGEFPGQLVPKARIGKETDEIIEPDDLDRKSGVNNYTQSLDATDSANSVRAFGSGIADGKGSQVAYEALNIADEAADLFDMQAWVSAGDIAFPRLLEARARAELALRSGSWENVEGEPLARDRLADTFPLTGVLSQFRWRPGDGVRLWLPDVGVLDTTPRAIFQVVRSFSPEGRVGTHIGFRARPKDPLFAVRSALREATRPARAYQKQYVSRPSPWAEGTVAAGGQLGLRVSLTQQDRVIGASVIIANNGESQPTNILINGVNRTTELGGPWSTPTTVSILPYAVPTSLTQQFLEVALKNAGAGGTGYGFQIILTLLV